MALNAGNCRLSWLGIIGNECPICPLGMSLLINLGMTLGIASRSLGTHLMVGTAPWRAHGDGG